MAIELVASAFLGILFENLSSLIQKEVGLVWGFHEDMKKLSNTLSVIQDILEDAEEKQLTEKAINNWLRKLKDAAYDADDVLDEWATKSMELESGMRSQSYSKQVCDSFLSCFKIEKYKFQWKIAKKINVLSERFDEIAAERSKFHLREGVVGRRVELYQNHETSSILTEPKVYGRDEEKESVVRLLLNNVNSEEDVSTCPILGIGGLGKTTLAQLVYNEDRVKEHFEVRIWVCVSEDFDIKRLTKAVIASISGNACDLEELDPLQCRLQKQLAGKRYLLVLDDVWNENQEDWNRFMYSLKCGAKGSSVIVTTRLETVASITGTSPPYCLKFLSEDDCWSLFKQRAFGMGNQGNPVLLKIGKEIVKKCGGVPLAAKALGGLMRFKGEENEWLSVRDSGLWDLPQNKENNILPALRLSYSHLPSNLRQCFAFCSIFPKDHIIRKEEVIHLWMANGFVQSKEGRQLEDIGGEIFDSLLWRSFFQDIEKDEDKNILCCKMHDLVHDLACSIMINECCNIELGKLKSTPRCTRYLSLTMDESSSSASVESISRSLLSLRTLLLLDHTDIGRSLEFDFCLRFMSLRAMSLEVFGLVTIPDSIGDLEHLRYLNFSRTDITSLPNSICRLRNLQTLKLAMCRKLVSLPKYFGKLSSLRHLDIRECYSITQLPTGIGRLTLLQRLNIFIVSSNGGCHINELQELNQLRGELTITGLECVKNSVDAKAANLVGKQYLGSLNLTWSTSQLQEEVYKEVIEGLRPQPNMRMLSIGRYQGLTFPSWLEVSSLPKLVAVSLWSCGKCQDLPSFGRLPFLKKLHLHNMKSIKFIDNDGVVEGFTSLEELELHHMPKLEGWSLLKVNEESDVILLPCLKKLNIDNCPKLMKLPFSFSLESLVLMGCGESILRSVKDLPSLCSLRIYDYFNEHISFPEGMLHNLTALQALHIQFCKKLTNLPPVLANLTALAELEVHDCDELVSFPEGLRNLSSLKSIQIGFCPNLNSLPELGSSLIKLSILSCTSLRTLPDRLTYQISLQELFISDCPRLEIATLEFQCLISLRRLTFWGFLELTTLPDGMRHLDRLQELRIPYCKNLRFLPAWLQHFTCLGTLDIEGCHPELHGRCKKESGADWPKIAHIPRLIFDRGPGIPITFQELDEFNPHQ